ncbi:MAG: DUF2934 domain-containing protein [Candidatus Thiodiazotropha sp. (ex Monitilora ramsayi)]|nr:DUF2934 domain-containing protein [Candidatus Thiodiazotropha sp. (ex Monitilora ramsayi)]
MGKNSDKKTSKKKNKLKKEEKKAKKAKLKKAEAGTRVTAAQRQDMIATAAYYIAESHGFTPGRSEDDWLAAEHHIDNILQGR